MLGRDVKKIIIKIVMLLLPVVILLAIPVFTMFFFGEFSKPSSIVARQNADTSIVWGLAYSEPIKYIKLHETLLKNPKILVLGNSRTLEFRDIFFREPSVFFNAALAIRKGGHLYPFLNHIPPDRQPEIIILGLDHKFFAETYDNGAPDGVDVEYISDEVDYWGLLGNNWMQVYRDYFRGKFNPDYFGRVLSSDTNMIGVVAVTSGAGYRGDGSYYEGASFDPNSPDYEDYAFKRTHKRIDVGGDGFEYATAVNPRAIEKLNTFLRASQERGIHVIGFLPPFPHTIYQKMLSIPDKYEYLTHLPIILHSTFDRYGFTFYDYSDLSYLGATDDEITDGSHGSEKSYVRLLLHLASLDQHLAPFVDSEALRGRLSVSVSEFADYSR